MTGIPDAAVNTGSLFATCPLPGCRNLVDDLRIPCNECINAFGIDLKPPGELPDQETYAAVIAARDADVARVHAERRAAALSATTATGEEPVQ